MDGRLAFIGFGEAATAFLSGWGESRPAAVAAFDIKTECQSTRAAMAERYAAHSVEDAGSAQHAAGNAACIFSTVTADQALAAAQSASSGIAGGALWLDCNSCAPGTKAKAAEVIEAAGGRYVDVAIMAPVAPKRHLTPLLVSGPHAAAAIGLMTDLGMKPVLAGEKVGQASSVKMLRSVMIKGMEAIFAECLLGARRAGVEDQVLASLEASDPDIAWRKRGSYNLERMMVHGERRAAEMREVAVTVEALGLSGGISGAAADWQDAIGGLGLKAGADDLMSRLDLVLDALAGRDPGR